MDFFINEQDFQNALNYALKDFILYNSELEKEEKQIWVANNKDKLEEFSDYLLAHLNIFRLEN